MTKLLRCRVYAGQVRLGAELFDGRHEPLVDSVTFERVQRQLAGAVRPARTAAAVWSLSGLVVCDSCDRPAWRRGTTGGRGTPRRTVVCRGQGCSGFGTPQTDHLEQVVLDKVTAWLADAKASPVVSSQKRRSAAEVKDIAREIAAAEAELVVLGRRLAQKIVSANAYRLTVEAVEESLTALRARLAVADRNAHAPTPAKQRVLVREMLARWPFTTPAERNAAMLLVVREVRVWRGPRTVPLKDRVHVDFR